MKKIGMIAAAGLGALAGLAGAMLPQAQSTRTQNTPRQRRSRIRTASWQPLRRNGDREKARRVRQIERGQLTASNGLEVVQ